MYLGLNPWEISNEAKKCRKSWKRISLRPAPFLIFAKSESKKSGSSSFPFLSGKAVRSDSGHCSAFGSGREEYPQKARRAEPSVWSSEDPSPISIDAPHLLLETLSGP